MQNLYTSIPTGENIPNEINVIIEIPEGSNMKYEYDHELGILKLDRVNYAPMPFPVNYGFVPQCWNSDDNDPADAIVFCTHPIASLVLTPCRVIGLMEMLDTGEKDDKIVCIPTDDARLAHIEKIEDLPPHLIKEIEFYFTNYKRIKNKVVEIKAFHPKEAAFEKITKGIADHKEKFGA